MKLFVLINLSLYLGLAWVMGDLAWILPFDQWEPEIAIFPILAQLFIVLPVWILIEVLK